MRKRIGLRDIAALQPGTMLWDSAVTGFGARRQRSEAVNYFCFYRTADGRQRWQTIGRNGAPWTPDTARDEARRLLGQVAQGKDPAAAKREGRKAFTVADLCDRYLADAMAGNILTRFGQPKKQATLTFDAGRIARHVKPLIGALKVTAVTGDDIKRLRDAIANGETAAEVKTGPRGLARVTGGRGAATRTLRLLGGFFTYAVEHGIRPDNPCRGVAKFADGRRTRSMTDAEYRALGEGLRKAEAASMWPPAVAAAKFLALTGWRHSEALRLTWGEVDIDRRTAMLAGTKTGASMRALSAVACEVLRAMPRFGGQLVFPSSSGNDTPMAGLKKHWYRIAKISALPADVSPHILRHSFASTAASMGLSDIVIAALLGHKGRSITSRYARAADPTLIAAADSVAERIANLMLATPNVAHAQRKRRRAA
jgi:integrase